MNFRCKLRTHLDQWDRVVQWLAEDIPEWLVCCLRVPGGLLEAIVDVLKSTRSWEDGASMHAHNCACGVVSGRAGLELKGVAIDQLIARWQH